MTRLSPVYAAVIKSTFVALKSVTKLLRSGLGVICLSRIEPEVGSNSRRMKEPLKKATVVEEGSKNRDL